MEFKKKKAPPGESLLRCQFEQGIHSPTPFNIITCLVRVTAQNHADRGRQILNVISVSLILSDKSGI